jgi:diguanylate cyclase (GGDEF)-like protein
MIEPPPFPGEEKRLKSVQSTGLLDTPIEERFERITRMVCSSLGVPIAIFNLIDSNRQHYKSVQGLPGPDAPLKAAFCTHALQEKDMLLVPDANKDVRFHDNPFVTGELLNVAFYAGCPVRTADGQPIGTLCAIDTVPRNLTPEELSRLRDFVAMIENELKISNLSTSQTELVAGLDSKARNALVDPLTRLWNLEAMRKILTRELADKKPLALARAQIDDFNSLKALLGPQLTDGALRVIGKKLLEALHPGDIAGHIGGADFLIIFKGEQSSRVAVTDAALRWNKLVTEDSFIAGVSKDYPVSIRLGVATSGSDANALIAQAEKALTKAPRGKVEFI